jgi:putative acetyltransferase
MDLIIRNERKDEYRAVEELTREAFWNVHVPGCNEHFCLHNMRSSPDFIPELDFVAELDNRLVGNIVYTHGGIVNERGETHQVICFGPVSVSPAFQKQGIGKALIRYSCDKAREMGFGAVLIYGDLRYYGRLGFRCAEKWDIKTSFDKFAVGLMALELVPGALAGKAGRFIESKAFDVDEHEFQKYDSTFPPRDKAVTESQAEFKVMVSLMY